MFEDNSNEAILYYLYMMADGEISYSEEKIFDIICNELNIDKEEKISVIKECRKLVADTVDVYQIIIREELDAQVGEGWYGLRDESSLARIIWNLVNLGFADTTFSSEEKEIVRYLVNKWCVKTEVYQELVDTADTMLALTKQKEWITSKFPKSSARDKREKAIDTQLTQLLDDVKLTIKELTM